jgi:hypothetical protein
VAAGVIDAGYSLPNLIGKLLLDSFLRVRRKGKIGCHVGMFGELTCCLVNVTKLLFVTLAPAADQKVKSLFDPHHKRQRLVH